MAGIILEHLFYNYSEKTGAQKSFTEIDPGEILEEIGNDFGRSL